MGTRQTTLPGIDFDLNAIPLSPEESAAVYPDSAEGAEGAEGADGAEGAEAFEESEYEKAVKKLGEGLVAVSKGERSFKSLKLAFEPMNPTDLKVLVKHGYDPDNWVTYEMLESFWGASNGMLRVLASRGTIPKGIYLEGTRTRFFPKEATILSWRPKWLEDVVRESVKYNLGGIVASAEAGMLATGKALSTQADYLQALSKVVTQKDWQIIVKRAVFDAKQGDYRARKWLSDYLMGTPIQRIAALVEDNAGQRFSKEERQTALQELFYGYATSVDPNDQNDQDDPNDPNDPNEAQGHIVDATFTDSPEVSGQDSSGQSSMDAASAE